MRSRHLIIPFTAFLFVLSSCDKDQDTIARIYVVNTDNEPVSGAQVKLVPEGSMMKESVAERTATTNSSGEAMFNLSDNYKPGQVGVAVLKIDVNNGQAFGVIKIEEEKTSEEKVII